MIENSAIIIPALNEEDTLRHLGFRQFRVRHHGEVARIEIGLEEMSKLVDAELVKKIVRGVKEAGFRFVALDLEGYRSGSMNAVLPVRDLIR